MIIDSEGKISKNLEIVKSNLVDCLYEVYDVVCAVHEEAGCDGVLAVHVVGVVVHFQEITRRH